MAHVQIRDILDVDGGVIAHQVNCRGKMNKGLAKNIRAKFPQAYDEYMRKFDTDGWRVGDAQFVECGTGIFVANLAGQDQWQGYGVKTDLPGLELALAKAQAFAAEKGIQLYLPYRIGAGLAGGDWAKISGAIRRAAPSAILCRRATD